MRHFGKYTQEDWAIWYQRVQTHTRVAPSLTDDLRSSTGVITATLVATAAASLAELDDDIVAGEYLAKAMQSKGSSDTVTAIVEEMSRIAQDLLQAIVEANASAGAANRW